MKSLKSWLKNIDSLDEARKFIPIHIRSTSLATIEEIQDLGCIVWSYYSGKEGTYKDGPILQGDHIKFEGLSEFRERAWFHLICKDDVKLLDIDKVRFYQSGEVVIYGEVQILTIKEPYFLTGINKEFRRGTFGNLRSVLRLAKFYVTWQDCYSYLIYTKDADINKK